MGFLCTVRNISSKEKSVKGKKYGVKEYGFTPFH
jgi:hypothetical protein